LTLNHIPILVRITWNRKYTRS